MTHESEVVICQHNYHIICVERSQRPLLLEATTCEPRGRVSRAELRGERVNVDRTRAQISDGSWERAERSLSVG